MKLFSLLIFILFFALSCNECPNDSDNNDGNNKVDIVFENFVPFKDSNNRVKFYSNDYIFEDSIVFRSDELSSLSWKTPYEIDATLYSKLELLFDVKIYSLLDTVNSYIVIKIGFENNNYFAQDVIDISKGTTIDTSVSKEIPDYMFTKDNLSLIFLIDPQGRSDNLNLMRIKLSNLNIKGFRNDTNM